MKIIASTIVAIVHMVVLAAVVVSFAEAGQTVPGGNPSTTIGTNEEDIRRILQEALADARLDKDLANRVRSLLAVAPILDKFYSQETNEALEEAIALIPKLPEGPSFWDQMLEAAISGAITGVWLGFLPKNIPLYHVVSATLMTGSMSRLHQNWYAAIRQYLASKDGFTLDLVQLLAPKKPPRALELALSIKADYARALGVEMCLRSWPRSESEAVISTVRKLAAGSKKEAPSAVLVAALASGVEPHDISLARELAGRAGDALNAKTDALTARQTYTVLARLDPEASRKLVMRLAENPTANATLLLAFANGVIPIQPELAWRALTAVPRQDQKFIVERAATLRQFMEVLPQNLRDEARMYTLDLLASVPNRDIGNFITGGEMYGELRRFAVVSDAVVSLGVVDPEMARRQAEQSAFSEFMGSLLLDTLIRQRKGLDKELRQNLLQNFIRLDLALSLLPSRPLEAFQILESLDDHFWSAFGQAAWRSFRFEDPVGVNWRLSRLVAQVKTRWPDSATAVAGTRPEESARTLRRFLVVSELLDTVAVAKLPQNEKLRYAWLEYLPFALTYAGRALQARQPEDAAKAFQNSMKLAEGIPSPAREWALCSNARAWKELGADQGRTAGQDAANRAAALKNYKPWELELPHLIQQVARLDPAAALRIARARNKGFRATALVAVVVGMLGTELTQKTTPSSANLLPPRMLHQSRRGPDAFEDDLRKSQVAGNSADVAAVIRSLQFGKQDQGGGPFGLTMSNLVMINIK